MASAVTRGRQLRLTCAFVLLGLVGGACSTSTTRSPEIVGASSLDDGGDTPVVETSRGDRDRPAPSEVGTATGAAPPAGAAPTTSDDAGAPPRGADTPPPSAPPTGGGDAGPVTPPSPSAPPNDEPFVLGVAAASSNAMSQVGLAIDIPTDQRTRRWVEALRDHINATGGVGGRPLETLIRFVDQSDQSEANQTRLQAQLCAEFTEDLQVDMVAGDATSWSLDCYAAHETPVFNPVVTRDEEQLDPLRPWVQPSFFLTFDRFAKLMPISLAQQGWISDRMGIFTFDLPWYERAIQQHLIPGIEAQGGTVLEVARTPVSVNAVAQSAQSAVVKFKSRQIDRVIVFANGGGAYLLFAQAADTQLYYPGYGLSTLDRPFVFTDLVPPRQRSVRGFGFWPTLDVDPESQPPPNERELECWRILNEGAGENFTGRNTDSQLASAACDQMFLVDAALDQGSGGAFGRADVPRLFQQLGSQYESITVGRVDFSAGREDSVTAYRNLTYDPACSCVAYTTDALQIPFD